MGGAAARARRRGRRRGAGDPGAPEIRAAGAPVLPPKIGLGAEESKEGATHAFGAALGAAAASSARTTRRAARPAARGARGAEAATGAEMPLRVNVIAACIVPGAPGCRSSRSSVRNDSAGDVASRSRFSAR